VDKQRTITLTKAAKLYGCGKQALYKLRNQGELSATQVGRNIYLKVAELESLFMGGDHA
jgi:excisionase family DNA binding protein